MKGLDPQKGRGLLNGKQLQFYDTKGKNKMANAKGEKVVPVSLTERKQGIEGMIGEGYEQCRIMRVALKGLKEQLEANETYQMMIKVQAEYAEAMEKLKNEVKLQLDDGTYEASGFIFSNATKRKVTKHWKLDAIRTQKWAPAVIIETVDEKVFKALEKTMQDPEQYYDESIQEIRAFTLIEEGGI